MYRTYRRRRPYLYGPSLIFTVRQTYRRITKLLCSIIAKESKKRWLLPLKRVSRRGSIDICESSFHVKKLYLPSFRVHKKLHNVIGQLPLPRWETWESLVKEFLLRSRELVVGYIFEDETDKLRECLVTARLICIGKVLCWHIISMSRLWLELSILKNDPVLINEVLWCPLSCGTELLW